jgi:hypothetical protein
MITVYRLGRETAYRILRISLGALGAERALRMLSGRSLHDREFIVQGEGHVLRCNVSTTPGWHQDGPEATIHLTHDAAGRLLSALRPLVGEYSVPDLPGLIFVVEESVIRDEGGREIERRGRA